MKTSKAAKVNELIDILKEMRDTLGDNAYQKLHEILYQYENSDIKGLDNIDIVEFDGCISVGGIIEGEDFTTVYLRTYKSGHNGIVISVDEFEGILHDGIKFFDEAEVSEDLDGVCYASIYGTQFFNADDPMLDSAIKSMNQLLKIIKNY